MQRVGVRELKTRATQIIRSVRDDAEEYLVTVAGEPVAVLRPFTKSDEDALREESLDADLAAIEQVARLWRDRPQKMTAAEAVADQRR